MLMKMTFLTMVGCGCGGGKEVVGEGGNKYSGKWKVISSGRKVKRAKAQVAL